MDLRPPTAPSGASIFLNIRHNLKSELAVYWMMFRIICFLLITPLLAQSPKKVAAVFSHTEDVGLGNEVSVLGAHPDLGGGVLEKAIKLTWSAGNGWSASIAVEEGAAVDYQFIKRTNSKTTWCDSANSTVLTGNLSLQIPDHEAGPYSGKTILYYSSWPNVDILCRDLKTGGAWIQLAMQNTGAGRVTGENIYRIEGIASSGGGIEFVFTDGAGNFDNAPAPPSHTPTGSAPATPLAYENLTASYNYLTTLDVFLVQDGGIYNYRPANTVAAARKETHYVTSNQSGFPSRNVQVLLPRGYDAHSSKRYPTLYMHDGQNTFFPGGSFGTWDADRVASYETAMGRMRECIIVAIDNGGSQRISEYTPPSDVENGNAPNMGKADEYLAFLTDDLKPWVDSTFRTSSFKNGQHVPRETAVAGSSLGGLVSDYISLTRSDVFGMAGLFSSAYWVAPNYQTIRNAAAKLPRRIYIDIGTGEGDDSFWNDTQNAYNVWAGQGYVMNRELRLVVGCGQGHNESAWARRLPGFFHFMLDPWLEPNWLMEELYPPKLTFSSLASGSATFQIQVRRGVPYTLLGSSTLSGWGTRKTTEQWDKTWKTVPLTDSGWTAPEGKYFWRVGYPIAP